jgi:hypothetical protein
VGRNMSGPTIGARSETATNRRSRDRKCRFGIDTIEVGFRDQVSSGVVSALARGDSFPTVRGFLVAEPDVCGARISVYESGLVKVTARLGALRAGSAGAHDLAPQVDLRRARGDAADVIKRACGLAPPAGDVADVRRLDVACERDFDDPVQGLAFLRAVSLMTAGSRYKTKTIRSADGHVETGYMITGRGRVLTRVYDKGVESKTAPPGHRLRLEAQARYRLRNAQSPEAVATADLGPVASRSWSSYVESAGGVTVAGPDAAVQQLVQRAASGRLSVAKAERMIGTLSILRDHGRGFYDVRQGQRRLSDLAAEGVVLDETLAPSATVPVGALLREFLAEADSQRPA